MSRFLWGTVRRCDNDKHPPTEAETNSSRTANAAEGGRANLPEAAGTNAPYTHVLSWFSPTHTSSPSEALYTYRLYGPHGDRRGSQWILDGISVKYLRSEMKCRGPEAWLELVWVAPDVTIFTARRSPSSSFFFFSSTTSSSFFCLCSLTSPAHTSPGWSPLYVLLRRFSRGVYVRIPLSNINVSDVMNERSISRSTLPSSQIPIKWPGLTEFEASQ